jgi:hypothetical protein
MTRLLKNIEVEEISLLSKNSRPAVRGALVAIAKADHQQLDFTGHIAEIRKRDGCSRVEALARARIEHPSAFEAYQDGGRVSSRPIERRIEKSDAASRFEKCVEEIRTRDRCTRLQALQKAAEEHPGELAAYRQA